MEVAKIVPVAAAEDVGAARRAASDAANRCGLDATDTSNLALVTTELATNILKHARRGRIQIAAYDDGDGRGIEILATDAGPGIRDLGRAMLDGYSTAGSQGTGLGAISRLSTLHDIYTRPDDGLVAMARVGRPSAEKGQRISFQVGFVIVPYPGETKSGDACHAIIDDGICYALVSDGTGHGTLAAEAAQASVRIFAERHQLAPAAAIEWLHRGLASSRGAAVAVAHLAPAQGRLSFAGLGNIAGMLIDGASIRRVVSFSGTAGHTAARVRGFDYPIDSLEPILILHTDGISSRWDLRPYVALERCHASVIAGVIQRDHARGRDDASVLVVKVLPS